MVGRGRVYSNANYKAFKDEVITLIRAQAPLESWRQGPVQVDILLRRTKAHARVDVINLVDGVCDAVKVAIGVDDRFFSCSSTYVDNSVESVVEITVYQDNSP